MPVSERYRLPDPVSALVLGTWGISGAFTTSAGPGGYSHVAEEDFNQILDRAQDAGIRWIDIASAYGAGQGLRRLAAWQRSRGRSFRTIVKPGRPLVDGSPHSDLSLDGLRAELRWCAQMTGYPAAILLKDPPADAFLHGRLEAVLRALAGEYPQARIGVATHRLDLVGLLPELAGYQPVVQLEYHMLNRFLAIPAARAAAGYGWEVWAMQPLAYGFLADQNGPSSMIRADDWRSRIPDQVCASMLAGARHLSNAVPPELREYPLAQIAIAWCLTDAVVSRLVVGPRSLQQMESVLSAARLALDPRFRQFADRQRALVTARLPNP